MKRTMTIIAAGALAAGMIFAQGQANQVKHRAMARQKFAEALNLTDAQKAQEKAIFGQAKQAAAPLRAEMKQDRQALAAAVKTNDTTKIDKLSAEEGHLIGKLMAVRTEAMARFYQTLTPAQKLKADQLHQERMQHRRERS
jgi:Spy/CpxP family protein refolding chaperone